MNLRVCRIERHNYLQLKKWLNLWQIDTTHYPTSVYFGALSNNKLVGVASLFELSSRHFRFKSSLVINPMQGKGIGKALFNIRMEYVDNIGYNTLSAFCSQYSLPIFVKNGFEINSSKSKIWNNKVWEIHHVSKTKS